MKKLFNIFKIFIVFVSCVSCSGKNVNNEISQEAENPEILYSLAMIELKNENYDNALKQFKDINIKFPLSSEAVQSQIMSAFIQYVKMNYEEAIFEFGRITSLYPSHKNIDYAYYMKAICYFEQIENEYLDGENNIKALESFQQVISRFPESKYARNSEQKIIFINENIAAKHMDIAFFYLKQKKYLAAMNRYQKVIENHSKSKFTPEALHRLVEIYYTLGMTEDAKKTASVLGYNYPKSKWYEYSYDLITPKDPDKKKSIFSKILNF